MQVGDLVRDTERDLGLIIKVAADLVKVMFSDETEWFSQTYLEVINK